MEATDAPHPKIEHIPSKGLVLDGIYNPGWFLPILAYMRPWLPFLLSVILPTLLVAAYYLGIASDQYVSEARFVVRGASTVAPNMLNSLLAGGASRGDENTYAVQDYIVSRDALTELMRDQHVDDLFANPAIDRLSRFPLLARFDTFEHLYAYYLRHIEVDLDSTTGVSSLRVKMFHPEDATRIAQALLQGGERLVNRMNERQRENGLRDSRRDVAAAEARILDIAARIAQFRNREALLDPTKQSAPMLQAIADMEAALTRINLQVSQLIQASPRSPLIPDYRLRAKLLGEQIVEARSKIAGNGASMVPKITEFDALVMERDFADKQLVSATASLEAARLHFERQQIYIDTVVQPNTPDYPAYPRQIASISIWFASLLGLYVMASLLIAGIREHQLV